MRSTGYILNGKYVRASEVPSKAKVPRKQPLHSAYELDRTRDDYRKDLIQPYLHNGKPNPEFIDAYPEESEKYGFVNKDERNA